MEFTNFVSRVIQWKLISSSSSFYLSRSFLFPSFDLHLHYQLLKVFISIIFSFWCKFAVLSFVRNLHHNLSVQKKVCAKNFSQKKWYAANYYPCISVSVCLSLCLSLSLSRSDISDEKSLIGMCARIHKMKTVSRYLTLSFKIQLRAFKCVYSKEWIFLWKLFWLYAKLALWSFDIFL